MGWLRIFSAGVLMLACGGGHAAAPPKVDTRALVAASSYQVSLQQDQLGGPGAAFLRRATADAQFVLAGEDHHDHFTPLFDLALLRLLHRSHGFDHVVVEQDPLGIEAVLRPPARGNPAAIAALLQPYPTLLGFASDEDLAFLAGVATEIAGPQAIWGIEQAQSPVRYLDELVSLARDPAARHATQDILADARRKEVKRTDFGQFITFDPTALARLQALQQSFHAPAGARADALLTGLVKSAEIYSYYRRSAAGEPVGLFNNSVREAWLKAGFTAHYRAAAAGGALPKALFKFGSYHMIRGLNPLGSFSLGGYLHELAIFNGRAA